MSTRSYDVVIYGATGFTGRQAAAYLAAHAPAGLRWAIAGRRREALEQVRASIGRDVPVIVADSETPRSVEEMVASTRVICTTAGPYNRYGEPVVSAAAVHGTHYTDITGETPWVRGLIDRYHAQAQASGARIVPFCGFDSVPSDLGTWMMVDAAQRTFGAGLVEVLASFSARGGFNGGTIATALTMAETGLGKQIGDRRLLCPGADVPAPRDRRSVDWDPIRKRWLAPFMMSAINTRVVRRSTALYNATEAPWGPLAYDEVMEMGSRAAGWGMALGLGAFDKLLRTSVGRGLIKRITPAPGEGPSEAEMDGGYIRVRLTGRTADGRQLQGLIAGPGDPGNRATVRMLMESTLALAVDEARLAPRFGVITPAYAFGGLLVDRLRAAGMTWTTAELGADGFSLR